MNEVLKKLLLVIAAIPFFCATSAVAAIYLTDQLTDNDYDDRNPQINDNGYLVWQGYDGNDIEIYLHDGFNTIQLTDNDHEDRNPQIYDNGYVVWYGYLGGCGGNSEIFLAKPIITESQIQTLISYINEIDLPKGIEKSLTSKLESVLNSLNGDNVISAQNKLDAFINEIESQKMKKIPADEASILIETAQMIKDNI